MWRKGILLSHQVVYPINHVNFFAFTCHSVTICSSPHHGHSPFPLPCSHHTCAHSVITHLPSLSIQLACICLRIYTLDPHSLIARLFFAKRDFLAFFCLAFRYWRWLACFVCFPLITSTVLDCLPVLLNFCLPKLDLLQSPSPVLVPVSS